MARGIRYTREFQEKALRLLGESRANHSSETKALASVSQSLGIAPETLRRWRNRADRTVTAQSARDAQAAAELKRLRAEVAELRKASEILTTASAFFSRPGSTRHGVEGRVHRRVPRPFRGRADLPGAAGRAGLRFPDRPRLPRLQDEASQPHGGAPRGIGA